MCIFFFKQKTAYEMRISDWSSDVCSSDLPQGISFDASGAAAIDRPVFLYYGEDDRVLLPSENALHVAPLISTLAGIRSVPNAGHWVLLAPCSEALAKEVGEICRDPAEIGRASCRERVGA